MTSTQLTRPVSLLPPPARALPLSPALACPLHDLCLCLPYLAPCFFFFSFLGGVWPHTSTDTFPGSLLKDPLSAPLLVVVRGNLFSLSLSPSLSHLHICARAPPILQKVLQKKKKKEEGSGSWFPISQAI